jgi:hypothetical protein
MRFLFPNRPQVSQPHQTKSKKSRRLRNTNPERKRGASTLAATGLTACQWPHEVPLASGATGSAHWSLHNLLALPGVVGIDCRPDDLSMYLHFWIGGCSVDIVSW